MNSFVIYDICKNKHDLLKHLEVWGLIPREANCPECAKPMRLNNRKDATDGFQWRCRNKISQRKQKARLCGKMVSFRKGTFFEKSKLSIFQILAFVNFWVMSASLSFIKAQLAISTSETAVNWAAYCREVLLAAFLLNSTKIGGPGKIVEISKSNFGKRKYVRGHRVEGEWVFGGYERGSGQIFMVAAEFRDEDTLLPIIQEWIEDGTTIISDNWKTYGCLESEGFSQLKVKHSLNFEDSETRPYANSIESSWTLAKNIASSYGRKKQQTPGNLAREMFFKKCSELNLDRTLEFFRLAGQLYNPNNSNVTVELLKEDEFHSRHPSEDLEDLYEELG